MHWCMELKSIHCTMQSAAGRRPDNLIIVSRISQTQQKSHHTRHVRKIDIVTFLYAKNCIKLTVIIFKGYQTFYLFYTGKRLETTYQNLAIITYFNKK